MLSFSRGPSVFELKGMTCGVDFSTLGRLGWSGGQKMSRKTLSFHYIKNISEQKGL